VEVAQAVQVEAAQAVLVAAIGRAANAARHAELVVVVVVATETNCSRSSPRTQHLMLPFRRASSLSSEACPHKSSLRNSIEPRPMSSGSF
jgi:hypothetical protein